MYVLERSVLDLIPAGERSRSSARSSRAWSATASTGPPRRLLDGHRHPRALPAGDLGHPRGRGGDAGRADRPGRATSTPAPRSPTSAAVGPRAVIGAGCRLESGVEVRESVLLDGCAVGRGRAGRALDPRRGRRGRARRRPRGRGDRPGRKRPGLMTPARVPMTGQPDARRRPRDPRPPSRRALAGRLGAPRAQPTRPGLARLRHGRLGDRRRPRRGGARRAPGPAAAHRPRLRAAELGERRVDRALLQLLGRDRGDARLLRGRRRAVGARRIVVGTGGALVERAREDGVPVVGLPGILQPRAAVAYMFVAAAEVAALAGVAPRIEAEIEAAAAFLESRARDLESRAAEIAGRLEGTLPVVYGADLTAPVARRWKTQINENAKLQAFFSELPEADHNEICGWAGVPEGTSCRVVLLEDAEQHPRLRRRFELTARGDRGRRSRGRAGRGEGETRDQPAALGGDAGRPRLPRAGRGAAASTRCRSRRSTRSSRRWPVLSRGPPPVPPAPAGHHGAGVEPAEHDVEEVVLAGRHQGQAHRQRVEQQQRPQSRVAPAARGRSRPER